MKMFAKHRDRKSKWGRLRRRHARVRHRVSGTAERPRLQVRKSLRHLYVIVVNDEVAGGSQTIISLSTVARDGTGSTCSCNAASAKNLGGRIAAALNEKGIKEVVFDRGGYPYHGVIKALADAVREGGIKV